MKVVFFDLETTGTLVNKHGIHQISGMIVIDGEVKETFDFKVQPNPKAEIVQEALDVAGVTKEQILSYPAMGYVYGQFTAILNKYVESTISRISFSLLVIIMLHLITSFSVHGSYRMGINILDLTSGVIL